MIRKILLKARSEIQEYLKDIETYPRDDLYLEIFIMLIEMKRIADLYGCYYVETKGVMKNDK